MLGDRGTAAGELGRFSPGRAWAAVIVLTIVGTLNLADRFLPAVLSELIKRDLSLSDTALGLINGFGFLLVYAACGIPLARLSDRGIYGMVISGCLAAWSIMTMCGGLVTSGWQLALTRMGVAVGEAGSTPAAHAFIATNFVPEKRAAPLAILTLSVPFAGTVGLMAGGLLGQWLGWRATFVLLGIVGLLFVPLVWFVVGPRQHIAASATATPTLLGSLAPLRKASYRLIVAASACVAVAGYSLTVFAPAYLMRSHGMTVGQVGVQYGLASGIAGGIGLLVIGRLADRLSRRDPRWSLWVVAAMIVVLLPCSITAFLLQGNAASIWTISLANIVGMAWMAPTIAAIQRLVPGEQRATASAILLFFTATIGACGPLITGAISDALHVDFGSGSLSRALLIVPTMHVCAAGLYGIASRFYVADLMPDQAAAADLDLANPT